MYKLFLHYKCCFVFSKEHIKIVNTLRGLPREERELAVQRKGLQLGNKLTHCFLPCNWIVNILLLINCRAAFLFWTLFSFLSTFPGVCTLLESQAWAERSCNRKKNHKKAGKQKLSIFVNIQDFEYTYICGRVYVYTHILRCMY